jgi:hypothetical protein
MIQAKERRSPSARGRSRAAGLIAVLLLGALAVMLWPRKHPNSAKPIETPDRVAEGRIWPALPAAELAPPSPPLEEPAPIIDKIDVEKPEVCEGEQNLITVHAHTVNGTNDSLSYVIDGTPGSSVPVTLLRENGAVVGKHYIRVFGRNNAATTVMLPEYRVNDCRPNYLGFVNAHLQPNSWADYDIVANITPFPWRPGQPPRNAAPKPFNAVRYKWSFGDGETAVTEVPAVSHSYENREQTSRVSYMILKVEASNREGDTVTGRTSLSLLNPAFEAKEAKGIVQLMISLEPRFPSIDQQGRVVQHVRLSHISPDPVTIDTGTMTKYMKGGRGEAEKQSFDVAKVLGTTTIPPGKEGITATVVLDTVAEPNVFNVNYELDGYSETGERAIGTFSVMHPPERPTAQNSKPVSDPLLKQKILAARDILKKDVVNDMEIAQLDREGKFAQLDSQMVRLPAGRGQTGVSAPPDMVAPAAPTVQSAGSGVVVDGTSVAK